LISSPLQGVGGLKMENEKFGVEGNELYSRTLRIFAKGAKNVNWLCELLADHNFAFISG
jgi:hypothetical protein